MQFVASFIALVIGGIIDTSYLLYQHYKKKPLICPMDHDCSVVTEGKWSRIFFVRNEILGLSFYLFMLTFIILSVILPNFSSKIYLSLFIFSIIGVAFSIFLVYLQIYKIRDYCFYCLISAFLTLLIFINSILLIV
ncbi:MAG: vitamin K epoxide reductase family protein [Patescibacteria group bacterium]